MRTSPSSITTAAPWKRWFLLRVVCRLSVVLLLPFHEAATTGNRRSASTSKFLWLSDLHLDPFYGTLDAAGQPGADCAQENVPDEGRLGCDTPFQLLNETLQQAAKDHALKSSLTFVVVTGDMCRHQTDQLDQPVETTKEILSRVSHLLRETLGDDVSIVPSLGNNDVTPDYYLDVQYPSELLTMAAEGLGVLFESDLERETFLQGGYFARNVSATITVLSLNTLLYSTSHLPDDTDEEDPLGQFAWLEDQLAMALYTDRMVYIIGHIPPAMGSYRHSQLWQEPFLRRYYSILQHHDYIFVIAGEFFGHLHSDEFRFIVSPPTIIETNDSSSEAASANISDDLSKTESLHWWPMLLASSVSPMYGSNPSYRFVSYDHETGSLLDYDTYYLNLVDSSNEDDVDVEEWKKGPSFCDSFDLKDMSRFSLQSLVQSLNHSLGEPNSLLWQSLIHRQHVFGSNEGTSCQDIPCRRAWICTFTTVTSAEYANCLDAAGASATEVFFARMSPKKRLIVGVAVVGVAILGLFLFLCRVGPRYLRRRHYQQQSLDGTSDKDGLIFEEVDYIGAKTISRTATASSASSLSADATYHQEETSSDLPHLA